MLKVYLAAAYSRKDEMNRYANELRDAGIEVTSRWLQEVFAPNTPLDSPELTDEMKQKFAIEDLEDIEDADWVVLFTEPHDKQPPRGGRHFEFGYAYKTLGTQCIIVGDRENIFHYLPEVVVCADWENAKQLLVEDNIYMYGVYGNT